MRTRLSVLLAAAMIRRMGTAYPTVGRRGGESSACGSRLPSRGLLHQLLNGHAVAPGDLCQGRHVGGPLAALQVPQGREGYVGKLRRLLLRKPSLLPKNPQLHRDRSRHHSSALLPHPRSSGPLVGLMLQMHYVVVHSPPWLVRRRVPII